MVNVKFNAHKDGTASTATLLLAAAEELELSPSVVETSPLRGIFIVPREVAEVAELDFEDEDEESAEDEAKKPVKKAATKRTPRQRAAKKTTPAKKAEAKPEATADGAKTEE